MNLREDKLIIIITLEGIMIKKLVLLTPLLFVVFFNSTNALANQNSQFRYFGVSAEISKSDDGSYYIVKTKGKRKNEGFVFTPNGLKNGRELSLRINLKGNSKVFIKLQETNAMGRYINETVSSPIKLNGGWQTVELETTISPNTEYMDVMVLTSDESKTEFYFKDTRFN
jgi:hypothetical protein